KTNTRVQCTVVDDAKAVMPGVTVTAAETSTGSQMVAVTGTDGRYRFENLAPGKYSLSSELSGFATARVPSIELLVGMNATVPPITMQLAGVQETVVVN